MDEVPNLVQGDLPSGLRQSWLAHFNYKTSGARIRDHYFTVCVVSAAPSVSWAERVLCHDRDLSDLDASNPAEGLAELKKEDTPARLESGALLERYAVWLDAD